MKFTQIEYRERKSFRWKPWVIPTFISQMEQKEEAKENEKEWPVRQKAN